MEKSKFQVYESPWNPENFYDTMLKTLEQKSREIIEKTQKSVQDIINKAYQDGFQKGYNQGLEKLNSERETHISNIQKELVNKMVEIQNATSQILEDYKNYVKNVSKIFITKFLNKYVKENLKHTPEILINALDEALQYVSTSIVLELKVNKKYADLLKTWANNKSNNSNIKITLQDLPDSQSVILGKDVKVTIDFDTIIDNLIQKLFV